MGEPPQPALGRSPELLEMFLCNFSRQHRFSRNINQGAMLTRGAVLLKGFLRALFPKPTSLWPSSPVSPATGHHTATNLVARKDGFR